MPTARLIVDASFTEVVDFYESFPTEPTVNPDNDLDVRLPIDRADRIDPVSLHGILTRMVALLGTEQIFLVVTHGSFAGLGIPLVPGGDMGKQQASIQNFHILTVYGKALEQIPNIQKLPAEQQPAEWLKLMRTLVDFDGNRPLAPDIKPDDFLDAENSNKPTQKEKDEAIKKANAFYPALFEFLLKSSIQKTTPPAALLGKVSGDFAVFFPGVTRRQLDELLDMGNKVRGKGFERLELRGCNIGVNPKAMEVMRKFFGCQRVTAPDVVAGGGSIAIIINKNFKKDLEHNIDVQTNKSIRGRGHSPVRLDNKKDRNQVDVQFADIPKTRRFDTDQSDPGDEVFMRVWTTSILAQDGIHLHHMGDAWLAAVSQAAVEQFAINEISQDISRWKQKKSSMLPIQYFDLMDDFNAFIDPPPPIVVDTSAPISTDPPPPPERPAFALPRDPQYRKHLVSVP